MINSEILFNEVLPKLKVTDSRRIHGDFKFFQIISSTADITSDDVLYLVDSKTFEKVVQQLPKRTNQKFSFLVAGEKDFSFLEKDKRFNFNQFNLSINELVNIISKSQSLQKRQTPSTEDRYITAFLGDLVDGHLTEHEEIVENLKRTPIKLLPHISLIVIESALPDTNMKVNSIHDFAACFSNCAAAYHHGEILILVQKVKYEDKLIYNEKRFIEALKKYNAIAVMGLFTKWLTSVRPIYTNAKKVTPFIRTFENLEKRIFHTEDFTIFEKVEIVAKYAKDYCNGDIHHMICPGALILLEHDEKHKTNYLEIIANYIDADCNISKAADRLFYHRNTLKTKLDAINDFLETQSVPINWDNSLLKQDLRFSIYLINYAKKILGRETPYTIKELVPSTAEQLEDK